MSHISMLQDFYPVGLVCNATATNLMGFFYGKRQEIIFIIR
jgi:hypothetical protein